MKLHFNESGSGEPLVLIHGLFGSLDNLGVARRALAEHYRVLSVDLLDHGQSPHTEQFSWEANVQALKTLLADLDIDKTHVLGHSLGGKIAMRFALAYPELLQKLIVVDIAPVAYTPRHQQVIKGLKAVKLENLTGRKDAEQQLADYVPEAGVRQFLLKSLYKSDSGWAWRFNLEVLSRDYGTLSEGIQASSSFAGPTQFIKGANSDYLTAEHQPRIGELFPASTGKIMQGCGHWPHAEKPEAFVQIVQRFLQA